MSLKDLKNSGFVRALSYLLEATVMAVDRSTLSLKKYLIVIIQKNISSKKIFFLEAHNLISVSAITHTHTHRDTKFRCVFASVSA